MRLALLFFFACGPAQPQITAKLYLPSGLMASEIRYLSLRAIAYSDMMALGINDQDLCQRYLTRTSFPDIKAYSLMATLPNGLMNGQHEVIDDLPANQSYVLIVEASDQPEAPNGTNPSGSTTFRACTPTVEVKPNSKTPAPACLYMQDDMGRLIGPPVSPDCPSSA